MKSIFGDLGGWIKGKFVVLWFLNSQIRVRFRNLVNNQLNQVSMLSNSIDFGFLDELDRVAEEISQFLMILMDRSGI